MHICSCIISMQSFSKVTTKYSVQTHNSMRLSHAKHNAWGCIPRPQEWKPGPYSHVKRTCGSSRTTSLYSVAPAQSNLKQLIHGSLHRRPSHRWPCIWRCITGETRIWRSKLALRHSEPKNPHFRGWLQPYLQSLYTVGTWQMEFGEMARHTT